MKTDLNFKLASYVGNRLYISHKAQKYRKSNKTFNLLKCSLSLCENRIIHQFNGKMTLENYGSLW